MLPIKKILSPTDFSEPASEGFKQARTLARHFGAELIVMHVNTPLPVMPEGHGAVNFNIPEYKKEMERYAVSQLNEFITKSANEEVAITAFATEGDAAEEIVRAANDYDADLIVLATHGHSGWRNFVTGSVTEKVVRTASHPVLTVHTPPGGE